VVRQNEIVGVMLVRAHGPAATVANLRRVVADLQRYRVSLATGISAVHTGLSEAPAVYAEACTARMGGCREVGRGASGW
jgi:hypothetical protein